MTTTGWQKTTLWFVGNRLPLGDPHDGQGHRPQLRSAFGPQGQSGLLISDEQQNVYFAAVQGSRLAHRNWLKLASGNSKTGNPIGRGGGSNAGSYRYTALHYPAAGFDGVTLEGTTLSGDSVSAATIEANLVQSDFANGQIVLHARSTSAASLTFNDQPRLLVKQRGVPEVIHWRRDASSDLLVAMEDGKVRRWQGLDDATLSPLPGAGEIVMAGEEPLAFDGLVHLCVVDWNMRGRSDLLVATADGELWLFYDVGAHDAVAYDCGRQLCDPQGPIQLFGGASVTLLRQGNERRLIAADGQGQLWQWLLVPAPSWEISDWAKVSHVATSNRTVANAYEPGHWWVQREGEDSNVKQVLRIGPPVLDHVIASGQPLGLAPLPPELTIPSPCDGPCEIHVTLASLEPVLKHVAVADTDGSDERLLSLDSMIDVRVGGQIHPQMVSAGKLAQGCTREIYWGTADLTDNPICLRGLHGGFLFEGGLPAAVVSLRLVPLTPQKNAEIIQDQQQTATHDRDAVTIARDANTHDEHPGGSGKILLQDTPSVASRSASVVKDVSASTTVVIEEADDELDDDTFEAQGNEPAYERVPLAGMLETFRWTSIMRADSAMEVDELVARHQEAGLERLYWRIGAGPWEYPSQVGGAQNTIPANCSASHESLAQRQADLFEHVNRLEMASAAAKRRGMSLFAWLRLHHQSEHQPPHQFQSVDQFMLDHPHFAEKDVHGQVLAGKLCFGFQAVRAFYISIVIEAMNQGVDGLMIDMADHLPRVQYGDPVVAEFKERHRCDMRELSPFDLRVVELQASVMTRFMRELRDAVHHARPRLRLPIHVRVTKPLVVMGCDPAAWAREHLIDAIILDKSAGASVTEHEQSMAMMTHLAQDTRCDIAAAIDARPGSSQSLQNSRIIKQVRRQVGQGASFIVFRDCATLVRDRRMCQILRRINTPDEHQPRALLS